MPSGTGSEAAMKDFGTKTVGLSLRAWGAPHGPSGSPFAYQVTMPMTG